MNIGHIICANERDVYGALIYDFKVYPTKEAAEAEILRIVNRTRELNNLPPITDIKERHDYYTKDVEILEG